MTLRNRLWLGLGLLILLLAAACSLALRALRSPDVSLARVVEASEARRAAVEEMRSALVDGGATAAAPAAMRGAEPRAPSAARFESALAAYRGLADTPELKALADESSTRFAAYQARVGDASKNVADGNWRATEQREIEALLADIPQVAGNPRTARIARKQAAARNVANQLRGYSRVLGADTGTARLPQERAWVRSILGTYQQQADTPAEQQWAARVSRVLDQGERGATEAAAARQAGDEARAEAEKLRQGLAEFLQQRMLPAARSELTSAVRRTARAAADDRLIERALLAILGLGIVVAALTSFAVRRPLRRLLQSTRAYVDTDLSYRTIAMRNDEAGELAWRFSELAERLERLEHGAKSVAAHALQGPDPDESRYAAAAFALAPEPTVVTDAALGIAAVNPAFTELIGLALADVRGQVPASLWSPDHHDAAAIAAVWAEVDERGEWHGEVWLSGREGNVHPTRCTIRSVRDDAKARQGVVVIFRDVTAGLVRRDNEPASLPRDAAADCPAQQVLMERLGSAVQRAQRRGKCLAVLRLEVEQLAGINRTLGTEEGVRLLHAAGERMRASVRGTDFVARLEGEEFGVLLEDLGGPDEAAVIAEKLLANLAEPLEVSKLELPIRASIGIAMAPADGEAPEAVMAAARTALEQTKANRRGRWSFFSSEVTQRLREQVALANGLRRPELREQLVLHFRPQRSCRGDERIVGVEALLRWQHPERGLLVPEQFMAAAASAGVVASLDEWTLQAACIQARRWIDAGLEPVRVAVVLSAERLRSERLLETLDHALQTARLEPGLLDLEVSEAALHGGARVDEQLAALHRCGVQLTLQDIRSRSAFNLLTWLPFQRVKVVAQEESDADREDLSMLVTSALARSIGVQIIGTAVENEVQATQLRAAGCAELEGPLVGDPVPAETLSARLTLRGKRAGSAADASALPAKARSTDLI